MLQATHPTHSSSARILIVDDDPAISGLLGRILSKDMYSIDTAADGEAALDAVRRSRPDLVLLDLILPGISGLEVCRRLKLDPDSRLIPVVMVTGASERQQRLEGLESGADEFLSKPLDAEELRVRIRSLLRLKRYTDDLDSAASIIMTLAVLIEARDGNTEGHCHRMANYATAVGRALHLAPDELQALHRGGFLHDIGMLAIPDAVLRKAGRLEPDEYECVKSHTLIGESLCGSLRSLQAVRPIIRHHHERLDGSGYPDGLAGDDIPLLAQIVGLVDVFDAVTTDRPYQGPRTVAQAVDLLRDQVDRGWRRPDLVETFAAIIDRGELESFRR